MTRMERLHPKKRRSVVAVRAAMILALAGCSNQQMSASNPFMSPDRVPPPATRTIAPGTAAPYYPGDPMPAAQNVAPGMPAPPMVAQGPANVAPVAIPTAAVPAAMNAAAPTAPQPLAFSNERSVSIPDDNQDLRFPLPPPPTATQGAAPQMAAAAAPVQPAQQVVPAAYTQVAPQQLASQPMPAAGPMPDAMANDSGGPWRSPQIKSGPSDVMQAQYAQPQTQQPMMLAAQPQGTMQAAPTANVPMNTVPVQLRSVPSPPNVAPTNVAPTMMQPAAAPGMTVDPTMSPPPRMRFPSWTEPSTWFTPQPATTTTPGPGQQLVGYMVPGPNGTQQMVSVEQYQAMMGGAAQPAPSVATQDGFRARGTSTK
jgi:hypothetical protein